MSSRGGAAHPLGWLSRVLLPALVVLCWAAPSHAYPWMIKYGYDKCASCHTDPMGGETLTGFGRVMSDTTLSTRYDGSKDPTSRAELFFAVPEPRDLRVGGSVRYMDAYVQLPKNGSKTTYRQFPMQIDVYGQVRMWERLRAAGSIGVADVPPGGTYAVAAQITRNNTGDRPLNLVGRNFWLGYDITDNILVRAGRLNLPFGLRIPEHVMWVRSATRTDRESDQQWGVAASYSGGRWRGEVMPILGNYQVSPDKFRERGYSAYGEYSLDEHTAIGLSSLVTHAADDRVALKPNTRQAHGATLRYAPISSFAVLAEADVLFSTIASPGYVGVVQGDYEFVQGFHGMLTGELLSTGTPNGSTSSAGSGEPAFGIWASLGWFFFTHFDARVDFVWRQNAPAAIQSQIHYYF